LWDASTNTPTLVNGTGANGDFYKVDVGGTVDFGAGGITFLAGDNAVYNGTVWQKTSDQGLVDPMTTRGDIIVRDATNDTTRLGIGTVGQALVSDGTDISWSTVSTVGGIDDLDDVDTTTNPPATDEALIWNGSDWVPGSVEAGVSDFDGGSSGTVYSSADVDLDSGDSATIY